MLSRRWVVASVVRAAVSAERATVVASRLICCVIWGVRLGRRATTVARLRAGVRAGFADFGADSAAPAFAADRLTRDVLEEEPMLLDPPEEELGRARLDGPTGSTPEARGAGIGAGVWMLRDPVVTRASAPGAGASASVGDVT